MVTGLAAAFALPADAANHSMDATMLTCADFTAMDTEGQAKSNSPTGVPLAEVNAVKAMLHCKKRKTTAANQCYI